MTFSTLQWKSGNLKLTEGSTSILDSTEGWHGDKSTMSYTPQDLTISYVLEPMTYHSAVGLLKWSLSMENVIHSVAQ